MLLLSPIVAFLTPNTSLEKALGVPDRTPCIEFGQGPWAQVSACVAKFRDVDALQTGHQCKLPAMTEVVGHDTPDGPLACHRIYLALSDVPTGLCQVGHHPAVKGCFDHLPARLQPLERFDGSLYQRFLPLQIGLQSPVKLVAISCVELFTCPGSNLTGEGSASRSAHLIEPPQPGTSDISDQFVHGVLIGCGDVTPVVPMSAE